MSGVIPRNLKEKTTSLSQTVFLRSTNVAHTHTHDDSIRRNAMRCISPKNASALQRHMITEIAKVNFL